MGTMTRKKRTPAIAYLRTSSATNVGADKGHCNLLGCWMRGGFSEAACQLRRGEA
jgi:hypothetical protein